MINDKEKNNSSNNDLQNELHNDEKELDEVFAGTGTDGLKSIVKKAKRHSLLRIIIISFIAAGVVLTLYTFFGVKIIYKMETPIQVAVDAFYNISAPNRYIGNMPRYHESFGGKNVFSTYKIIEGRVVYTGHEEYYYGVLQKDWGSKIGSGSPVILGETTDEESLQLRKYNELGQMEMVFFYPFNKYRTYRKDLSLLEQIGPEKHLEMALSFDKTYSIDEVNRMVPKNVTLAWYWIDDLNEAEKENYKNTNFTDEKGKTSSLDIKWLRSEKSAYGIKAYDANGAAFKQIKPEQMFIWALESGKKYDTRYQSEFERLYKNLVGSDGKLAGEDIKVQGVVVTGDAGELKSLRGLPFITASSLGVVVDKY